MTMLMISFLGLAFAPVFSELVGRSRLAHQFLDGLIFVAVGGLVVFSILPLAYNFGGWPVMVFLVLGLILPGLSEKYLAHRAEVFHRGTFVLGVVCLILHAMTDGAALSLDRHAADGMSISLGIILHRVAEGLWIWQSFRPKHGLGLPWFLLGLIVVGTFIGYFATESIHEIAISQPLAWFQALVAGSLLHAIIHRFHGGKHHEESSHCSSKPRWMEGVGNIAGGLIVWITVQSHVHPLDPGVESTAEHVGFHWQGGIWENLVHLTLESAPALLLAYVVAGFLTAFLSDRYLSRISKGTSWRQALMGVFIGLPLPVCSCSVVPLYQTLVKKGAPLTAAIAFLIATPELGIDAVLISLPLLGFDMTVLRIVCAALIAFVVAIIVGRLATSLGVRHESHVASSQGDAHHHHNGCCPATGKPLNPSSSWQKKLKLGLKEGLGDLVDHTGPWIVLGLVIAALMMTVIEPKSLTSIPPYLDVLIFALIGMPLYVCASGATPLVAALMASGLSPGAAMAFLITGPATNMTTFGVLSKLHGSKFALGFAATVLIVTVLTGIALNGLFPQVQIPSLDHQHESYGMLQKWSAIGLVLLFGFSVLRRGARAFASEILAPYVPDEPHDHPH